MDHMDVDVKETSSPSTASTEFDQNYLSYPLSNIGKNHLDTGNKIIMPASALNHLIFLQIDYPMLFCLENTATSRHTHCGVLEFSADEGLVFLPTWMMNYMQLQQGDLVNIRNTSLPKGNNYMKIQPHATEFITFQIINLCSKKTLRDFACLTIGDTVVIDQMGEKYDIDIVETKRSPAISLFDTDCVVEFAPALDYNEPEKKPTAGVKRNSAGDEDQNNTPRDDGRSTAKKFKPFQGVGRLLDGTQMLKMEESVKPKKKQRTKFKPFTGVGRRVDGQPLEAATAEEEKDQSSN